MKRIAIGCGTLLLTFTMAGCGVPTETPLATPIPTSTTTDTDTPTTTAAPSPTDASPKADFAGVAHISDADGYTFDVKYFYTLIRIDKAIANEKPGLNSAIMKQTTNISLTNTTPGRDITFMSVSGIVAPLDAPQFMLVATWKATSPVCTVGSLTMSMEGSDPKRNCAVLLSFGRAANTLAADATSELTVYSGIQNGQVAGVAQIPDADYSAVTAALKHPDSYALAYASQDNLRFVSSCRRAESEEITNILYNNGIMPIFASGGTCERFQVLVQPPTD